MTGIDPVLRHLKFQKLLGPITSIHLLSVFGLLISSTAFSGASWLRFFIIYISTFIIGTLFWKTVGVRVLQFNPLKGKLAASESFVGILAGAALGYVFVYFLVMGIVPIWNVSMSTDYYAISRFRTALFEQAPIWIRYSNEYYFKAIAPFLLVVLFSTRSKLTIPIFILNVFFAANMIAKAYVACVLIPLLIFQLLTKRLGAFFLTLATMGAVLAFLVFVTNPQAWPRPWDDWARENVYAVDLIWGEHVAPSDLPLNTIVKDESAGGLANGISHVLYNRLVMVPGQVTDQWFSVFPSRVPFLRGCGYRYIAVLIGCEYVSVPRLVFDIVYADLVSQQGLKGTVTAAHFLNEFVNFGLWGLILSGFLTSFVISKIERIQVPKVYLVALNFVPILFLLEASLPSVLHTGGLFLSNFLLWFGKGHLRTGKVALNE